MCFHAALTFYKQIFPYAYCPLGISVKSVPHFILNRDIKQTLYRGTILHRKQHVSELLKSIKLCTQITVFTVFEAYL
jgi:hypothetical protein